MKRQPTYLCPVEVVLREREIRKTEIEINYQRAYINGRLTELKEEVQALVDKHTAKLNEAKEKLIKLMSYTIL
jgi:uncharacterized protein (DUF302 family)